MKQITIAQDVLEEQHASPDSLEAVVWGAPYRLARAFKIAREALNANELVRFRGALSGAPFVAKIGTLEFTWTDAITVRFRIVLVRMGRVLDTGTTPPRIVDCGKPVVRFDPEVIAAAVGAKRAVPRERS